MAPLKRLIHEAHRRSLWQVVGIYLAGSWVTYQVVLGITDGVGLPSWVPPFAIVLFLIGLPIVVATAFVQEGGPTRENLRGGRVAAEDAGERAVPTSPDTGVSGSATPESARRRLAPRLLTWPKALLGGVLAFALLGMGTSGYMAMRVFGVGPVGSLKGAGLIDARERVLVADFRSTSGDTALAGLVTEAFRVDLGRSTLIRVVQPADVVEVLRRMERTDVRRIDADLAREVAVRDGIRVVIEGDVAAAAGAYVLSGRIVASESGEVLAAHRESARDSTRLLEAIDRLSRRLRERTGESFRDVRSGPPLADVITPSLEALRLFTSATRAQMYEGDANKAIRLLQDAVALDTAFASAHRAISVHYGNRGRFDLAVQSLERALRHPHRLTERERLGAIAAQHVYRRETVQAIAAYEALLAYDPTSRGAWNNLALTYAEMRDFQRAAQSYRRAIELDTTSYFVWTNLGELYALMGDTAQARAAFGEAVRRAPAAQWPVVNAAIVPATAGDFRAAEVALRRLVSDSASTRQIVNRALSRLVPVVRAQGRLREAERLVEESMRASGQAARIEQTLLGDRLAQEVWLFGRRDRASALLERLVPLAQQSEPLDPEVLNYAIDAAQVDVRQARLFLDRYGTAEQRAQPWADARVHLANGLIAGAEGDIGGALTALRRFQDRLCVGCEEVFVARAFEAAAEPDSVIAAWERYLAKPSTDRMFLDWLALGPAYERLAQLYEQRGDVARARRYYGLLVDLWEKADPELQPRVRQATLALERLAAEPRTPSR